MELWTLYDGKIIRVSPPILALFNATERALKGRYIQSFFNRDRDRLMRALDRAARGQIQQFEAELRPRDRRPLQVLVTVERDASAGVHWLVVPGNAAADPEDPRK